jgi:ubiquinone/menaquinone biosynthesis C-methylase UbiE
MGAVRKPYAGLMNVISFNRHFYVAAFLLILFMFVLAGIFKQHSAWFFLAILLIAAPVILSLIATHWVYDRSGFYDLHWLNPLRLKSPQRIANITAGFDETSGLLKEKFPKAELLVFDFYDRTKHTERSIEIARTQGYVYAGTEQITTRAIPAYDLDLIFCIFSLHEIRNTHERRHFLKSMSSALNAEGRIMVVEHSRDLANFIAYTIGYFHFHSKATWRSDFHAAGLNIETEKMITPFVTIYTLKKNGTAY